MAVLFLGACNSFKLFQSTDDKSITANIQAKLFSDPLLKTRDIRVDSRYGVVTLSGSVGTDLERAAVERMATQEDGVKNVVNMLSVTSQSTTPASESVPTAETVAPPQQIAPPSAPPAQQAPEKPRRAHRPLAVSEDKASAELHTYTNSVTPDAAINPTPTPAPTPAPVAAAVAPTAPPPETAPPAAPVPQPPAPTPAPKPQEHLTIPEGTVLTVHG